MVVEILILIFAWDQCSLLSGPCNVAHWDLSKLELTTDIKLNIEIWTQECWTGLHKRIYRLELVYGGWNLSKTFVIVIHLSADWYAAKKLITRKIFLLLGRTSKALLDLVKYWSAKEIQERDCFWSFQSEGPKTICFPTYLGNFLDLSLDILQIPMLVQKHFSRCQLFHFALVSASFHHMKKLASSMMAKPKHRASV